MASTGSKKKKRPEKLTFSLNGGGMGRRDAAVTMQGRLGLLLSSHPAKTRFMTSRIPSYFSSWCTLWVVYLGLRALLLSPSLWGFYDLQQQHATRGSKKRTLCYWSVKSTTWHILPHKYEVVCLLPVVVFVYFLITTQTEEERNYWLGVMEESNNTKVSLSKISPQTLSIFPASHRALSERSYIQLCPLLCMSLLYPLALPSPLSSGSVIDRLQQLRPPTALSSFGDTLSVLIRALIGRLAVGEWHQGLGHRGDTDFPEILLVLFSLCLFLKFSLSYSFFSFSFLTSSCHSLSLPCHFRS